MADVAAPVRIDPRYHDAVLFDLDGVITDPAPPHPVQVVGSTIALIRRLADAGVAVAVYSASRNCAAVLESAGIADLFGVRLDGVVAEELALPSKPDPAMLIETARRLGVRPARAVVVEDSEAGVTAARVGGFGLIIGVNRTGDARVELGARGADAVVGDLAEVTVRDIDRRMSALPDALSSLDQSVGVLDAHRPALFFDFDGTLSKIVDQPDRATLVDGAAEALRALAARYPVAVLSGRDLADIRARVGIPGLWYAGSHGFEMVAPDGTYHSNETAAQSVDVLRRAADELTGQLADIGGVSVEHKRYAVAVHYRNAAPASAGAVHAAVRNVAEYRGLKMTAGRKVVELRPNVDWDKGKTLEWILGKVTDGDPLVPIFIGDDLTDEDAFDSVLHDGIGIVVRHTEDGDRATAARYSLNDPDQVREFLDRLVGRLG
jgi:trehalose-phosphatase